MKKIRKFKIVVLGRFLILLITLVSCNNIENKERVNTSLLLDTLPSNIKNIPHAEMKNVSTLENIFLSIKLSEINKIKTQKTFGFLSKSLSTYFYIPNEEKNYLFGFYFLLNRNEPTNKSIFNSRIVVYGQKKPWGFLDSTETLVDLQIFTQEIVIAPYLKVGSSIDSALAILGKPLSEFKKDDATILIYQEKNIILSINLQENKIHTIKIGRYKTSDYPIEEINNYLIENIK
jgi:hypothetical protein